MAKLINEKEVEKLTLQVITEDMNKALDIATKKVISELENTIRRNVAARMIAAVSSEYAFEYFRNELRISVRINNEQV
jgi:predicted DNA binding CopG/RHH family protein